MAYIFDTALNGQGPYVGKAYFFRDDRYLRYDWATDRVDSGPTSLAAWNLPAPFNAGVDAALNGQGPYQGYAYFFRGNQYVRYVWSTDQVGSPASLSAWNLPADFASGIDTALNGEGSFAGKAYFFRGNQWVRYDWASDRGDLGPTSLGTWHLPAPFHKGVHATLNGERQFQGRAYFFRGPHYARYFWSTGQAEGPVHLDAWKLRGGIGSSIS